MSRGINKVILVGDLVEDVTTRYNSNVKIATLRIETADEWFDKNTAQWRATKTWHRVVTFGDLAQICKERFQKGAQLYVEGKLETRAWTDNNTGQKRYTTEIKASVIQETGPLERLQTQEGSPPSSAGDHRGNATHNQTGNAANGGAAAPDSND